MSAKILDGKILAKKLKDEIVREVQSLKKSHGSSPRMINILVGDDHGSCAYANSQKRVAQELGIEYELLILPADVTQQQLEENISTLNQDKSVNGIMLHKPIPEHLDYSRLANLIDIEKDLEGINVANIGKMILDQTRLMPCTPASVMEHIKSTGINLRGKEVVIVGHSQIVGKPLSLLLLKELATVTVCHIGTSEAGKLQEHVGRADILVVAAGRAGLIKGDWIKKDCVVVDVGINNVDGKIVGDVEFDAAQARASFITPVPGGVGPVTVVMLMRNAVEAYKLQLH